MSFEYNGDSISESEWFQAEIQDAEDKPDFQEKECRNCGYVLNEFDICENCFGANL